MRKLLRILSMALVLALSIGSCIPAVYAEEQFDVAGRMRTKAEIAEALDAFVAKLADANDASLALYNGRDGVKELAPIGADKGELSKRGVTLELFGEPLVLTTTVNAQYDGVAKRFSRCTKARSAIAFYAWQDGVKITSSPVEWKAVVVGSGSTLAVSTLTRVQISIHGVTRSVNIRLYTEFYSSEL